jgi:trk system potassium uptake protein TrkH
MKTEAERLAKLDRFASGLGLLSLMTLLLHFGFPDLRLAPTAMAFWTGLLPAGLFVESLYRLLIVRDPWRYLRTNPLRYLVLLVILFELSGLAGWSAGLKYSNPSMVVGQIYLAAFLCANIGSWAKGAILANRWLSNRRIPVLAIPAITFAALIIAGALVLWLPGLRRGPVSFIDQLFTATSAVCVTGLQVYDVGSTLSPAGQLVLAALIQLGGIGTMTVMGLLAIWSGGGLTIGERTAFSELVGGKRLEETRRIIASVMRIVVGFEAAGAFALWLAWRGKIDHAVPASLFHAVSAFCNAGFSLFRDGMEGFAADPPTLAVIMVLIVCGGIGFPVLSALGRVGWSRCVPWRRTVPLPENAKLALAASAALLALGAAAFWLDGRLSGRPRGWLPSLFQSVTTRTAGFQTEPQAAFGWIGWAATLALMAIGASPQSTGGGLKTTVAARLIGAVRTEKTSAPGSFERFGRSFRLALTLAAGYAGLAGAAGAALALLERAAPADALFEAFSALGTVGLTRGLTPGLSAPSKLIVVFLMFAGRVLYPTLVVHAVKTRRLPDDGVDWA